MTRHSFSFQGSEVWHERDLKDHSGFDKGSTSFPDVVKTDVTNALAKDKHGELSSQDISMVDISNTHRQDTSLSDSYTRAALAKFRHDISSSQRNSIPEIVVPDSDSHAEEKRAGSRRGHRPRLSHLGTTGGSGLDTDAFNGKEFVSRASMDLSPAASICAYPMGEHSGLDVPDIIVSSEDIRQNMFYLAQLKESFKAMYSRRDSDNDDPVFDNPDTRLRALRAVTPEDPGRYILLDRVFRYDDNALEGRFRAPDSRIRDMHARERLRDFERTYFMNTRQNDRYKRRLDKLASLYDNSSDKGRSLIQCYITDRYNKWRLKGYFTREHRAYFERRAYIKYEHFRKDARPVLSSLWHWRLNIRRYCLDRCSRHVVEMHAHINVDMLKLRDSLYKKKLDVLQVNVSKLNFKQFEEFNAMMDNDIQQTLAKDSHAYERGLLQRMDDRSRQLVDLIANNQYATWLTGTIGILLSVSSHGAL